MTGEPHVIGGRYRHDLGEEMVDPLPVLLLGEDAGGAGRSILVDPVPVEGCVARAAAPPLALDARDADVAEIVEAAGMPCRPRRATR